MVTSQGVTDEQIPDDLCQGLPHLADPSSLQDQSFGQHTQGIVETPIDSGIVVSIRIDNLRGVYQLNVINWQSYQPTIDKEGLIIN